MQEHAINILMADDDPDDIELVEEAILQLAPEAKLHKFFNGHSVLQYLLSSNDDELPCLIILDYNMPQLNGLEVLSFMKSKERYVTIPKVVLSTSDSHIHKHECMNKGAVEYFVKPDNMNALRLLAKKLISYCKGEHQ
jgi:CheY-like chemotaxis protein